MSWRHCNVHDNIQSFFVLYRQYLFPSLCMCEVGLLLSVCTCTYIHMSVRLSTKVKTTRECSSGLRLESRKHSNAG